MSRPSAARTIVLIAALASVTPQLCSAMAMNLAGIAAARSGLDQTWTTRWRWNADGQLLLKDVARAASNAVPTRNGWRDDWLPSRARAYQALDRGNFAEYRREIVVLVESRHGRPWEVLALVKLYESSGRHDLAVDVLKRDGAVTHLLQVADAAWAEGDGLGARRLAEMAYEAVPESAQVDARLGHILVSSGWDAGSIRNPLVVLEQGLHLDPGNAAMRLDYAHALVDARRYDDAMAHLEIAAAQRPRDPTVHVLRGEVLLNRANLPEAADEYSKALDLDRDLTWALHGLGRVYLAEGRRSEATAALHRALIIDPSFQPARDLLAAIR
jgi:tetratricopeptide (TPR) repeat protein